MERLFIFFIVITLLDFIYRKFYLEEIVEDDFYPSNEELESDKMLIKQFLKTKKYRLTLNITFDKLNIEGARTYFISFKNEHNEKGKSSVIVDNDDKVKLINVKILEDYRKSKSILKYEAYRKVVDENRKYKSKIKELRKLIRELPKE